MSIQAKTRSRSDDVIIILEQYQREHDVVAWQRVKYAIKALSGFWVGKGTALTMPESVRQYMANKAADAAIEILGYET